MSENSTEKMLARRDGAVGHMVFNNPDKRNAVSLEMWQAAERILADFEADPEIRVVVLSGAGGKSFVSGADISEFEKSRGTEEAQKHYNSKTRAVYARIEAFPKPVIAMIHGHCIGGGLNLACCCDMRVGSETASFAMPAAKLALGYPFEAIRRLINAVGAGNARFLMYTARRIGAEEALRMGLLQEMVPGDRLEAAVDEVAKEIAANAPLTVAAMKFISGQVLADPQARDLQTCEDMVAACFASEDYREGRRAFMEKRKPQFQGR